MTEPSNRDFPRKKVDVGRQDVDVSARKRRM